MEIHPSWSEIPPLVIEKVFSLLSRRDQISMSLVCRSWHDEYSFPSLWRRLTFCLPYRKNNAETCPEMGAHFATRYGTRFHHLEILFENRIQSRLFDTVLWQLKLFLQAVTNHSQLLSIKFTNMESYLRRLETPVYEDVYRTILTFLNSQKKLQYVEFSNTCFRKQEAAGILNVIFKNNFKTLRCILLMGFVSESSQDQFASNMVENNLNFLTMMNLEVWKLHYSQIFEHMILSLYESRNNIDLRGKKGRLQEMELFCNGDIKVNYLTIHPDAWKYFRTIFPGLRIKLTFQSKCTSEPRNMNTFIALHMPLRAIDFQWKKVFSNGTHEIGLLLRRITSCEANKSLEVLRINWCNSSANLAPDLISFTDVCPCLKFLELYLQHPVLALDTVFNSWVERRPMLLEIVNITILSFHNLTEDEEKIYTNLRDFYVPMLQSAGLSLLLFLN